MNYVISKLDQPRFLKRVRMMEKTPLPVIILIIFTVVMVSSCASNRRIMEMRDEIKREINQAEMVE